MFQISSKFSRPVKIGAIILVGFNVLFLMSFLFRYNDQTAPTFKADSILALISGKPQKSSSSNVENSMFESYDPVPIYEIPGSDGENDGKDSKNGKNGETGGNSETNIKLTGSQKILSKLNEVSKDPKKYFLAHTKLTDHQIEIDPREFSRSATKNKAQLFYDPRLTFSVYLSELKRQFIAKNPLNSPENAHKIEVPFAWQDWVDLTELNKHMKDGERVLCADLAKKYEEKLKIEGYCIDSKDMTAEDLAEMGLPNQEYTPGFAMKLSPETIATNQVRILEAKSHLLTYAKNPLKIVFLTRDGVYEANVAEKKQRMFDLNLVELYFEEKGYFGGDLKLTVDPVEEYYLLVNNVPLNVHADDPLDYTKKLKEKNVTSDRQLYVGIEAYNYGKDKINEQLTSYREQKKRLSLAKEHNNIADVAELLFSPQEKLYYELMEYMNQFKNTNEPTYFKLARLTTGTPDNPEDAGWHYEWRFFNGALRYQKPGWSKDELLTREKIVLDRILRNWFRFAQERGILLWIAHGPLLAWYWDGLLFPYDEDIDIQLPAQEIIRFCRQYNQTLVVEDATEGFGKYLIDCSSFVHHRDRSHNQNHIDARFIDVDSGLYIDITGLGILTEKIPEKYKQLDDEAKKKGELRPVYNCRNVHFYAQDELLPFRLTNVAGIPMYIPNRIKNILKDEYARGMVWYEYYDFYYVNTLNLWLHVDKFKHILPKGLGLKDNDGIIKALELITDEDTFQILDKHDEVLIEYYLTHQATQNHREEMSHLFEVPSGAALNISQIGNLRDGLDISKDLDYHRLTAKFSKFKSPVLRPLFNYEYIDRLRAREQDDD